MKDEPEYTHGWKNDEVDRLQVQSHKQRQEGMEGKEVFKKLQEYRVQGV